MSPFLMNQKNEHELIIIWSISFLLIWQKRAWKPDFTLMGNPMRVFILPSLNEPLISPLAPFLLYDHPLPPPLYHGHWNNPNLQFHWAKITVACLVLQELKNFISTVSLWYLAFHFYVFIFTVIILTCT